MSATMTQFRWQHWLNVFLLLAAAFIVCGQAAGGATPTTSTTTTTTTATGSITKTTAKPLIPPAPTAAAAPAAAATAIAATTKATTTTTTTTATPPPSTITIKPRQPAAADCLQPLDPGPCRLNLERYYYNAKTNTCETFKFGGCRGNNNKFGFRKTCEDACVKQTAAKSALKNK